MSLKLFVWTDVLASYTTGIAFAIAETTDQARELIVSSNDFNPDGTNRGEDLAAYRKWLDSGANLEDAITLWRDLQAEPDVYDTPFGTYQWGSA